MESNVSQTCSRRHNGTGSGYKLLLIADYNVLFKLGTQFKPIFQSVHVLRLRSVRRRTHRESTWVQLYRFCNVDYPVDGGLG